MKQFSLLVVMLVFSVNVLQAQQGESQRIPLIGSKAPSFKSTSTNGLISFPKDFEGKWKILFSHPRDFTPVCSSELLDLAFHQDRFMQLNTQIVVISVDKLASHRNWKKDLESIHFKGRERVNINFPLVVDSVSTISYKYGMLDLGSKDSQSLRGVFFIDPENTIRAFQFYPIEVGRSTHEILRTLQALQARDSNENVLLPVNWEPGDDFMIPFLAPEDKKELKKGTTKVYYVNWYMIYKKAQ